MESNNNAIIDKLKESVIGKLDQLDASKKHDSTLIDYILVMVVNKKGKFEMKNNLSLFLGKVCDDFVNWLFEYMAQLKLNFNSNAISQATSPAEQPVDAPEVKSESNNQEKTELKVDEPLKRVVAKRKLKSAVISSTPTNNDSDTKPENSLAEDKKGCVKLKKRPFSVEEDISYSKKRAILDKNDQVSKRKKAEIEEDSSSVFVNDVDLDDISKENQTKFLVTLDGVKDMFKDNDLFLLDEDFDPELMREDLSNATNMHQKVASKNDMSTKENNNSNKVPERCKFWPSCMNANCEFFHPVTKCNTFPYCRFGDKCLYVHPTCKFDQFCSRKDCPFVHTTVKRGQMMNPSIICKYFPNCMKGGECEFFHPKPKKICHFGAACKSFNCPFAHLPPQNSVPHQSKFKWSSSKTNPEMAMSTNNEIEIN